MHGSSPTTGAPARILVLYSDIGEGHAATARAIGAELAQESPDVEVVLENGLAHMGRFLQYLQRDLYHAQLLRGPWLYGLWYAIFATSRILRALGALALCLLASRPLLRLVSAQKPDLIVSTDPRVSVVLGHLRMRGKLVMPLCATLTDLGGLKFWVHPGVDVHLTTHPRLVPAVERLAGKGSARLVSPPVHPAFYAPLGKAEAREALTLPAGRTLVLVSGGGWGTGDLEGALLAANGGADGFLGIYTPNDGKVGPVLNLPATGLAFFDVIPPIGSKFTVASVLGPESQSRQVSGEHHGMIRLRFVVPVAE